MLDTRFIERRIFRLGVVLTISGGILCAIFFGPRTAVSFAGGGLLAGLNLAWLRSGVNAAFAKDPSRHKGRILGGFFLRLILIPLTLYAMIRFLSVSIPAAVAGFAVFNCSIFVEGILEAFDNSSRKA